MLCTMPRGQSSGHRALAHLLATHSIAIPKQAKEPIFTTHTKILTMSYKISRNGNVIKLELIKKKLLEIDFNHFTVTRVHKGLTDCCDLFIHTKQTKKKWIDDNLFYELALMINEEFPNHGINWINTFIAIEQENYSDHLIEEDKNEEGIGTFENINSLFESDEILSDEFSKPEVRNGLLEQVTQKLKQKAIIK